MKGPTTKLLPFLCMKCNTRAPTFVLEYKTKDIVEICKCNRLLNRTTGQIVGRVIWADARGEFYQLIAGEERPTKMKDNDVAYYLIGEAA